MKLYEFFEDTNDSKPLPSDQQLRNEILSKIQDKSGTRLPKYRNIDVERVLSTAKGIYPQPGHNVDTAVDAALKHTITNKKSSTAVKQNNRPDSKPFRVTMPDTDNDYKQDTLGRTLRHDRYYRAGGDNNLIKNVKDKVAGVAKAVVPGAEELGQMFDIGTSGLNKGKDIMSKIPTNKSKSKYKR